MKFSANFVLLSLGLLALRASADPVGMAANVKGSVALTHAGAKGPLRLLGRVEPGDVVSCGPNSSAVIVLFGDGSRFQIGANKRVSISASNVAGGQRMAALEGPSAGAVKLLGSARVGAVMMRPASEFKRLTPDAPPYLLAPTTSFQWEPILGAAHYTFTLFDDSDNIVWSTTTDQTNTSYPTDAPSLLQARPYTWRLCPTISSGKPLPQSKWGLITVLSSEDARTVDEVAAKLRAQATASKDYTPLLVLEDTYRSYGMVNSALELLDTLRDSVAIKDQAPYVTAKNNLLDSQSPLVRLLAGRPVPPNAYSEVH